MSKHAPTVGQKPLSLILLLKPKELQINLQTEDEGL